MKRNHIHLATGTPSSGVISGMRTSCEIIIYVNVALAMEEGVEFFMSANGVVLTAGVDGTLAPKYFQQVVERVSGRIISTAAATEQENPEAGVPEQLFDKLVVLDFEATCLSDEKISPQEIIEIPSVIVDVRTKTITGEWRTYVRPVHHPVLSSFCKDLTGIQQEQVAGAPEFPEAFAQYMQWLTGHDLLNDRTAFVTCGNWDLQTMLPAQAKVSGLPVPGAMTRWINVKQTLSKFTGRKVSGMLQMLEMMSLELEGRHHCGLDDCRNIARVCVALLEQNCVFAITSSKRR